MDAERVNLPPARPVMIFDGDCRFCRQWIERWEQAAGERMEFVPFQATAVPERFPEIPRPHLEQAVHLVEPDGRVSQAGEAVFRSLPYAGGSRWPLRVYETSPLAARAVERVYRFVAEHRDGFSRATRWLWGESLVRPTHFWVRWVFLRLLGLTFFIAFVSLWTQIHGLSGSQGIEPAAQIMAGIRQAADFQQIGWDRYRLVPTLCWVSASDGFLSFLCGAGTVLSVCLLAGVAPVPALLLLWLCYLSLTTVCRVFLSYQWDNLLLETSFLALFLAPTRWWPGVTRERPPSRIALWLLRWLLFRLMFASAVVKLASGDPTWHNLTALSFHYETQPLPNVVAWHVHQLPEWIHKASVVGMFFIELLVPFGIFLPRRLRLATFIPLAGLQGLIALTGNYCFFNLLSLALCVLLLDDRSLLRWVPARWRGRLAGASVVVPPASVPEPGSRWVRRGFGFVLAAMVVAVTGMTLASAFRTRVEWPRPLRVLFEWLAPWRTFNGYGLFAVMTTTRPEIVVEGSVDEVNWRAYEFKHKPGDVQRCPRQVAPHQPRLDWQMWFAALGTIQQNPWFGNFCVRLLQGTPEVLALLAHNPFADQPPQFLRAVLYEYHFTTPEERRATGAWWRREYKGLYLPPVSLPGSSPPAPTLPPVREPPLYVRAGPVD